MNIDVCFSPTLFPLYIEQQDSVVIVVDIFRATTCMCVAFDSGVCSIRPVADLEDAKRFKRDGFLVGAEQNVAKCDFADFGNSPSDYRQNVIKSQEIVMCTTNGTKAIEIASKDHELFIGSFSNLSALADFCVGYKRNVIVLCSGWNGRPNLEDSLFAGAFCERLMSTGFFSPHSDAALMSVALWKQAEGSPNTFLQHSEHVQRLLKFGLADDIDFCLRRDTTRVLPYFNKEQRVLLSF